LWPECPKTRRLKLYLVSFLSQHSKIEVEKTHTEVRLWATSKVTIVVSSFSFPPSIDEYVDESSPVRVLDAFVDGLDLEALSFTRSAPASTGRPGYDPRDLLKLYVYGYANQIRSSRRLMRECRRNLEVIFLLRGLVPDFRTIADFRKENAEALKRVFQVFTKVCVELDLYRVY
jgi:transposase